MPAAAGGLRAQPARCWTAACGTDAPRRRWPCGAQATICAILRNQRRPRLLRLQGQDLLPPRAAPHAGARMPDRPRPMSSPAPGPAGGRRAVPRPADRRHRLLPRRRTPSPRWPSWSSPSFRGPRRRRHGARLGAGLRDRRGGLLASPSCCASRWTRSPAPPRVQIFATDIDERALAVARAAAAIPRRCSQASRPERLAALLRRRTARSYASRRRCATSASSRRTASSATRPSPASTWCPAATC